MINDEIEKVAACALNRERDSMVKYLLQVIEKAENCEQSL